MIRANPDPDIPAPESVPPVNNPGQQPGDGKPQAPPSEDGKPIVPIELPGQPHAPERMDAGSPPAWQ